MRSKDALAWRDFYYWMDEHSPGWQINGTGIGVNIETIEGIMHGNDGDWVIRGVQGETYPCRDDIFRATYEPVEDHVA